MCSISKDVLYYSLFSVFFEYLVHFPFLGLIILGDVLFEHWNLS